MITSTSELDVQSPSRICKAPKNDFDQVPVIDVEAYLSRVEGQWQQECQKVAESLHKYGVLIFKDPRAQEKENEDYISLMEKYFDHVSQEFYEGKQLSDAKPEFHYQTGVTPEKIERARNHYEKVKDLPEEDRALSEFPPTYDAKWRYMWKIGARLDGAFDDVPQVIPEAEQFLDGWEDKMNTWGFKLLAAAETAAEMAAIGMGLPSDTFSKRMRGGAHLLAPTGTDLQKYDVGTTLAGLHYDIALLTVHGKSRFPGLYIWLRNWKKVQVSVPKGCLLLQAGSTFEHITGGYVLSGYHEVIYTEATKQAMLRAKEDKDRVLWRVSSTLFSHMAYNVDISPLEEARHLYNDEEALRYRKMTAYEKLMEELRATSMTADVCKK